MGDDKRIPIESRGHGDPVQHDGVRGSPIGAGSSSRLVREPSRWTCVVTILAVVGLVAGGVVLVAQGSDGTGGGGNHAEGSAFDGDAHESGQRPGATAAGGPRAHPSRVAFAEAVLRLERAGSFAYRGSVQAREASALRPGVRTAVDVTVEGGVVLRYDLTREVAVAKSGAAVETVTSGPTVWSRAAMGVDGLEGRAWDVVPSPGPNQLGMAAVVDLVRSADHPRGGSPDTAGRRVIRANLPRGLGDGGRHREPRGGRDAGDEVFADPLLAGADVFLTLDDAGDIAHIVVTSAPVDPRLVLALDIVRLGEPQAITVPDTGDAALRRTVPLDALAAAGVTPVELGRAPSGWMLTGAWVAPGLFRPSTCPLLQLVYRAPQEVFDDYLRLGVTGHTCGGQLTSRGVRRPEPFRAGSFAGTVVESSTFTSGTVFNGDTAVDFSTDLSADDAAKVLATLTRFDVGTQLAPLDGVPR